MAEDKKQAKNNVKLTTKKNIKQAQEMLTAINVNRIKIVIKADEKIPSKWMDIYLSQFLS